MSTRELRKKALDVAGEAREKAIDAARNLEMAFEEIDDRGPREASQMVSTATRQLREAAELLEKWDELQ